MTTIELLQQIGLNKYEAEAYYALLVHGALTGYEVGKRSQVPLSRSYEILERLVEKGLALVQPGEPPRYAAQDPQQLLGQVRAGMESTLSALSTALAALEQERAGDDFWVVRGWQPVLMQARAMIAGAGETLELTMPLEEETAVGEALTQARMRGCHVFRAGNTSTRNILLLCDTQQALVGTLSSQSSCQAVVSANPALVAALRGYFDQCRSVPVEVELAPALQEVPQTGDWIGWEMRKQRRLQQQVRDHRVA
ncbi:MAG: TrmB family transcriptional regulator [Ktedonobacteraceae bacterium]|nr:TrmB family transcriptional regulator [Ktedonobacteraceae bacterium]